MLTMDHTGSIHTICFSSEPRAGRRRRNCMHQRGKYTTVAAALATVCLSTGCGTAAPAGDAVEATPPRSTSEPLGSDQTVSDQTESTDTSTDAPTQGRVGQYTLCTPPPFEGNPPPSMELVDAMAVVGIVEEQDPELFAGSWFDGKTSEFVATTVDAERAAAFMVALVPAGFGIRIEVVPYNRNQQAAVQRQASEAGYSSGGRAWDGRVEIMVPVLDEASLAHLAADIDAPLDAICITGADPATVPPDGPQQTEGDGWRLLADQTGKGDPWQVHIARDSVEYDTLWTSLEFEGDQPGVDFEQEVVVHFGAVYSGSCPEIRLDNIEFNDGSIDADVVQLGGLRVCTADANARAYLVAIPVDRLPAAPFTVQPTSTPCGGCLPLTVDSIEGTRSNLALLRDFDRSQVLAAAASFRLGSDNSFASAHPITTIRVIDTLATADPGGDMVFANGVALTEGERMTIQQTLAPIDVEWMTFEAADGLDDEIGPGVPILALAQPTVHDGRITMTSSFSCGSLCGTGGTHTVARDTGGWVVTGRFGPQWEA